MKQYHFEHLKPLCPNCLKNNTQMHPLTIGAVEREEPGDILEGLLTCSNTDCQSEFPIIDGIPIIVNGLRAFIAQNILPLTARSDLSPTLQGLLGDCCGPGSAYDTGRQHLSMYTYGHYGDLDPREPPHAAAGNILESFQRGLAVAGEIEGPALDLGCAVGRATFELAAAVEGPVLGVDLNVGMLQTAARILRTGIVRYPRRRVGLVYDQREFEVQFESAPRVDFWACDVAALPLARRSFGFAAGLNLLDCTPSPVDFLEEVVRVLKPGGKTVLSTPYDWSATPMESWIGGHSQRSTTAGAAEPMLRAILAGSHPAGIQGLRFLAERDAVPWTVRLHNRSTMQYQSHLIAAQVQ